MLRSDIFALLGSSIHHWYMSSAIFHQHEWFYFLSESRFSWKILLSLCKVLLLFVFLLAQFNNLSSYLKYCCWFSFIKSILASWTMVVVVIVDLHMGLTFHLSLSWIWNSLCKFYSQCNNFEHFGRCWWYQNYIDL